MSSDGELSESALEDLWWHLQRKCHGPFNAVHDQLSIDRWRLDAAYEIGGKTIAVELDGKAYHEYERDRDRDRALFATGKVSEIIRIPFAALWYYQEATMAVVAAWHPEFARAKNIYCVSVQEWQDELRKVQSDISEHGNGDYRSVDDFIESNEANFDIWHVAGRFGYVGGPKAFTYDQKQHAIERRVATDRYWNPGGNK